MLMSPRENPPRPPSDTPARHQVHVNVAFQHTSRWTQPSVSLLSESVRFSAYGLRSCLICCQFVTRLDRASAHAFYLAVSDLSSVMWPMINECPLKRNANFSDEGNPSMSTWPSPPPAPQPLASSTDALSGSQAHGRRGPLQRTPAPRTECWPPSDPMLLPATEVPQQEKKACGSNRTDVGGAWGAAPIPAAPSETAGHPALSAGSGLDLTPVLTRAIKAEDSRYL
jgi:hypothetical protein